VLDVLAIPGHQAAHIALYDRNTGLLLTDALDLLPTATTEVHADFIING
jgi:glyoxylase-like metal-dependent hydrolase (beta-lactamase superfamily II)